MRARHVRTAASGPERQAGGAEAFASPACYSLPLPPSANRLFKQVGRRRVKSQVYVDWQGHAAWVLRSQKPEPVHGRYLLVISVERPTADSDIDNRIKALSDLLVREGVTGDDSLMVGLCISWSPPSSGLARVMILPADSYGFKFHLSQDGASGGFFLAPQPKQEAA